MGRLLALILGGLALALFLPPFFFEDKMLAGVTLAPSNDFDKLFFDTLGAVFTTKLKMHGAGVFAGLALILFAVRGKD